MTESAEKAAVKSYGKCTDEELAALAGGDQDAADFLMERYKLTVRSLARTRFLIGGDTDDLIQEGMIGLYKAIRDYNPDREASFRTFAVLCISRQLSTAIESSNRHKNQPLNSFVSLSDDEKEEVLIPAMEGVSPENILIGEEEAAEMMNKIRRALSPMERRVLKLYLSGLDYTEIAAELGREPKSIDNALQRIRTKVRKVL